MKKCVNGVLVEMTAEEIEQMMIAEQEKKLETMQQDALSREEAIDLILSQYTIAAPNNGIGRSSMEMPLSEAIGMEIELPFKLGYKWEKVISGNRINYEAVPDPDAIGTFEKPIIWSENIPMIDNAYYKREGKTYVYMSGEFVEM